MFCFMSFLNVFLFHCVYQLSRQKAYEQTQFQLDQIYYRLNYY